MDSNKDRIEDLASLFLPDLLNPSTAKNDTPSNTNNNTNTNTSNTNQQPQQPQQQPSSFQDFLSNNNFINRSNDIDQHQVQQQQQQFSHINHYAPYLSYDANPMMSQPLMNFNQPMYQPPVPPQQILQQQQQAMRPGTPELQSSYDMKSGSSTPKKKKAKGRKRDMRNLEVEIDYKSSKLKRLLDFKQSGTISSNDYKIIDKDNNEVSIDFNGFLNGRFLTNDIDNNNYIFTRNELHRMANKKEDPKVVSCYRRNYIQISVNMNIHGFKNDDSKLLKLQTSEYGYTTTRVIKYFKIEILAATNISNNKSVPIVIKNDPKDLEKYEYKDDLVQPTFINTHEHVIILNDEVIENGAIDKYFVVKKLQFKNATPNNGNLTFQNYYHLKAKLSCIVADIYYDDYDIDVDTEGGGNNNNEILLGELVSEPIIVRGRNPSFYSERKDILIKGRSAASKRSFKISAQAAAQHKAIEHDEGEDDMMEQDEPDDDMDEKDVSQIPPLSYSTNQLAIDAKSVDKYKYYPINNVYYLPPINTVYFPHRAHHQSQRDDQDPSQPNPTQPQSQQPALPPQPPQFVSEPRKGSNVYFK
ncbi:vib-1 Transcription factor vib-1 [Candida maltosa Xu316]